MSSRPIRSTARSRSARRRSRSRGRATTRSSSPRRRLHQPGLGPRLSRPGGSGRSRPGRHPARPASVRGGRVNPVATYSFLPWLRQGIANTITAQDLDPSVKTRATTHVELKLSGDPVGRRRGADRYGRPGHRLVWPRRHHRHRPAGGHRTDPRNWITNFEANYLPAVDFYDADFPWRYTPAAPDATGLQAAPLDHPDRAGRERVHRGPGRGLAAVAVHHRSGRVGLPASRRVVGVGARPRQRHPVRRPQPARRAGHDRGAAQAAGHRGGQPRCGVLQAAVPAAC